MAQSARLKAGTIFVAENVEAKIWIGVLPLGQDWRVCSNEGIEHADSLQAAALSDTSFQALRLVGDGMTVELLGQKSFHLSPPILQSPPDTAPSQSMDLAKRNAFATGTPNDDSLVLR